jgi:hypothetical protein
MQTTPTKPEAQQPETPVITADWMADYIRRHNEYDDPMGYERGRDRMAADARSQAGRV